MHRSAENQFTVLRKLPPPGGPPPGGQYVCRELGAGLIIADAGGVPHGAFSGFLGQGRMEALTPVGRDVWALPCPRALDHTPPGDWTLRLTETATWKSAAGWQGGWSIGGAGDPTRSGKGWRRCAVPAGADAEPP